jgi:hypothetical protein
MRIKLMPDFECSPLWWDGKIGRIGNIAPDDLALPLELWDALWAWVERYDATLDQNEPCAICRRKPETIPAAPALCALAPFDTRSIAI